MANVTSGSIVSLPLFAGLDTPEQAPNRASEPQQNVYRVTTDRRCPRCTLTKPRDDFGTRTSHGKQIAQTYCRPCMVAYHSGWRRTERGAESFTKSMDASRARYPEREKARSLVQSAIYRGTLVKGPCELLDADCRGVIDGHHDDYTKPLEVRWVCRAHHRVLDRARQSVGVPLAWCASRENN